MEKVQIRGIHHIALKCRGIKEFDKTVAFYTELLGLKKVREWGSGDDSAVMLDTGAGLLEIFANAPERLSEGALRHIAFEVKSVDACIAAVREAGYKITVEPNDIEIPSNPPLPARIAFCIGEVGEEIEFFELR